MKYQSMLINKTPENFIPSETLFYVNKEPALWFIFHDRKLFVDENNNKPVPYLTDLSELSLIPDRIQFIGRLNDIPCFSAEVLEIENIPSQLSLIELRQLFGLLDEYIYWIAGRAFQIMNWDRVSKYCGNCGELNEPKKNEYAKICRNCHNVIYPQVSPAIIVAVTKGEEILLAQANRFKNNMFSVLAGFVEPGESLEDCVKREVKEEVGIKIKNIKYFGSQPWAISNSLMIAFTAEYDYGEICIDKKEILDANWYTADDLPNIPSKMSIARKLIDWYIKSNK